MSTYHNGSHNNDGYGWVYRLVEHIHKELQENKYGNGERIYLRGPNSYKNDRDSHHDNNFGNMYRKLYENLYDEHVLDNIEDVYYNIYGMDIEVFWEEDEKLKEKIRRIRNEKKHKDDYMGIQAFRDENFNIEDPKKRIASLKKLERYVFVAQWI